MLDDSTRKEIDKVVERTLRDAGFKKSPIRIEYLLQHLRIHRRFYNLKNPSLLQRFMHKTRVGEQKLKEIFHKIKLEALWDTDNAKIIIEQYLPKPKQEWASFHDVTHTILEWHREYFLGDTAQTLDPDFQEELESEANYGGAALMFGGKIFTQEALDTIPV